MAEGVLYVVATPIGNLSDISLRALEILAQVDRIAAEDTRHSRLLLREHGIRAHLLALHQHNEAARTDKVLAELASGQSVALISDAGTPLVSDPGQRLVRAAHAHGFRVVPIPGACALVCALSAAGLPAERFVFEGFLPRVASARRSRLGELRDEERTLVFYESSHRVVAALGDMTQIFGSDRPAVLARELTKRFETVCADTLAGLQERLRTEAEQQRGEFVLVVAGAAQRTGQYLAHADRRVLELLLAELPVRKAVTLAARITGKKRKLFYDLAVSETKSRPLPGTDAGARVP